MDQQGDLADVNAEMCRMFACEPVSSSPMASQCGEKAVSQNKPAHGLHLIWTENRRSGGGSGGFFGAVDILKEIRGRKAEVCGCLCSAGEGGGVDAMGDSRCQVDQQKRHRKQIPWIPFDSLTSRSVHFLRRGLIWLYCSLALVALLLSLPCPHAIRHLAFALRFVPELPPKPRERI
eukprot:2152928-Rhodomonas_salina.1